MNTQHFSRADAVDMHKRNACLAAGLLVLLLLCGNGADAANGGDSITAAALLQQLDGVNQPVVLDVRSPLEYLVGHIPGALNVPHKSVDVRIDEIGKIKDRLIVVYCEKGVRARFAAELLRQHGFTNVKHLEGDMPRWKSAHYPIAKFNV